MSDSDTLNNLPLEHCRNAIIELAEEKFASYKCISTPVYQNRDYYMCDIYRIRIEGTDKDGKDEILHCVLKIPSINMKYTENWPLENYFNKEVYAYSVMLPTLSDLQSEFDLDNEERFTFAKCYKANAAPGKQMLLLDDLSYKHFKFNIESGFLNFHHATLAFKKLAHFHALSFVMKKKDESIFKEMTKHTSTGLDFGNQSEQYIKLCIDSFIKQTKDVKCKEAMLNLGKDTLAKLDKYLNTKDIEPYDIICHGDCWFNNFLFRYEEERPVEVYLLDWQLIRHSSPMIDIFYIMYTSLDKSVRSKYFDYFLDVYYDTLRDRLLKMNCAVDECYPKSIFLKHLELFKPYGILIMFPVMNLVLADKNQLDNVRDACDQNLESWPISEKCLKYLEDAINHCFQIN